MATILRPPLVSDRQPKRPIAPVDYFSRPLTLGINPNASVAQLSDSAPQRKRWIQLDVYPSLLGTTLASGAPATLDLPLRSGRLVDSAPRKRWQPDAQSSQGFIVYDGPEAQVASITDSAPRTRKVVSVEHPINLLANTMGWLSLPVFAIRLDASAPRVRPQSRIEALSRPLTLGINDNAAVAQLSDSAPPPKKSAYSFDPPNLLGATMGWQAQMTLPLFASRVDWSAPAIKYPVRIESLSRPLALGVNPNAAIAQLSTSAPPPKRTAYPFDPPNLIDNTLAEPLTLPRLAVRLSASAPQVKRVAYLDTPTITITTSPPPEPPPGSNYVIDRPFDPSGWWHRS